MSPGVDGEENRWMGRIIHVQAQEIEKERE